MTLTTTFLPRTSVKMFLGCVLAESISIGGELTGPGKFGTFLRQLVFGKSDSDLDSCLRDFDSSITTWVGATFNPSPRVISQMSGIVSGLFECLALAKSDNGPATTRFDEKARKKLFCKSTELLLMVVDVYREILKKTVDDCRALLVNRFSSKFDLASIEFARTVNAGGKGSPEMNDRRSCVDWMRYVDPNIDEDNGNQATIHDRDVSACHDAGVLTQMFYLVQENIQLSPERFIFPDSIVLLAPTNITISVRKKIARGLHGFSKEFVTAATIVAAVVVAVVEHYFGIPFLYMVPTVTIASVLFVYWAGKPSSVRDYAL